MRPQKVRRPARAQGGLAFERLLFDLSAALAAATVEQIDETIVAWLARLVEFLDVDRSSVVRFRADGAPEISHSWARPGIEPGTRAPIAHVAWFMGELRQNRRVVLPRLPRGLPPDARAERDYVARTGMRAVLAIPLYLGGELVGAISFGVFRPHGPWPPEVVRRLRVVGNIVAGALARKQVIVERLRATDEAMRLRRELAHVGRLAALGELVASLSHEIKQPLTAILANAQAAKSLLAGEPADVAEARAALSDIADASNRADEIIRRIRDFLRKGEHRHETLDLGASLSQVGILVSREAVERQVDLRLEISPGLPLVRGDRVQLQQVALNLILNGFDAMSAVPPGERRLLVQAESSENGGVAVRVSDTGCGLPGEMADHLFEPFFTTKEEGLGMGLAMCKTIVEAHGGKLTASSNPGGGASFHFELQPAAEGRHTGA